MILSTLHTVETIASHHLNEWKSSAVSDEIINQNVRTIYDSRELDKILSRNTKNRRKHSDHLVPAWCVSGIDPLTGENTLEGVQVKPDTAPVDKNGKVQKYIGTTGASTAPLFLNTGIEYFWKSIIEDKSQPIIITEGAKKAGAGITLGIPTISIPGVTTCRKFGRLHYWLEAFTGFGRTFYLCFDADILEKRPVQNALISLARDLSATGSKVMIITLSDLSLKGMDDFIATKGGNEFRKLIEEAPTIEEWKKELDEKRKTEEFDFDGEERKSKLYRAYRIVREGWGDSIRLNLLKKQIELDDSTMDLDQLKFDIAENFDMDVSKEDSLSIVMAIAKRSAYSPVIDYLNSLAERYPNPDTSILDNFAFKYFGSADPLHNTYIRKTLIAAVARARQPGCKADDACILVGAQGLRKSTFWQELFGVDWFTDELSDSNEKDELMKLHQFWGLELPEIEHIYKRKDVGSIKKFLSSRTDAFRYPYDRQIKEQPRSCILVGTSNEQELLNDPTGNRRFLIIPVSQMIPVDELIRDRDLIWAAANHLYQMGHQWYLTHAEYALQAEANKEYQSSDPWEEIVLPYIQCKGWATTHDILLNALGLETSRQDKLAEKRVAAILKLNGWQQQRKWEKGIALRVWLRKVENSNGSNGSSGSTQAQQGFEYDPLEKNLMDQMDHSGSSESKEARLCVVNTTKPSNSLCTSSQYMLSDPLKLDVFAKSPSLMDHVEDVEFHRTLSPVINTSNVKNQECTTAQILVSDPFDPLEKNLMDHPEPSHSKLDPDDPLDPLKFPTFPKKNVVHNNGVTNTTVTRPQRCSYYSLYEFQPFLFKLESDFGSVQVSAEPYHKFKSGDSKIWLAFQMPDGQILTKSIKATPDKKLLPRWSVECGVIQQWQERVRKNFSSKVENSGCKFKVRILGDDDYQWIEDCTLKGIPNPPTATHFIFTTSENAIVTSHFGEFEEM